MLDFLIWGIRLLTLSFFFPLSGPLDGSYLSRIIPDELEEDED